MPFTNEEMFVIIHFGSMDLSASAVHEILRLKIQTLSDVAEGNYKYHVSSICKQARKGGYPALRSSSGEWKRSAVDDFLDRIARDLSDGERRSLTQIGDAEQQIIKDDRIMGKPEHERSSRAPASPPAHTTGFYTDNQSQTRVATHATDRHSPRRSRHEISPPRSHHYQTGGSSTATNYQSPYGPSTVTNYQSPYGPSGNNYGGPINNQPAYNSAIYGGGLANPGAPLQSSAYPYPAPITHSNHQAGAPSQSSGYPSAAPATTPHSGYHVGSNDREGERRSTRPGETSGSTSTNQRLPGPRGPGGRDIFS